MCGKCSQHYTKQRTFPLKSQCNNGIHHPFLFNRKPDVSARRKRETKGIQRGNKGAKLLLSVHTILKSPKRTKKFLELMNTFKQSRGIQN